MDSHRWFSYDPAGGVLSALFLAPRQLRSCRLPAASRYGRRMSAQPTPDPGGSASYEVIHLGGEAAAIVPLQDLRRLQAVERRAPAELLEDAEIEATLAEHREWAAAGRPGAVSHEEAMAELLGDR